MALVFGTSTALTITAGSLASAAARSSAAVTVTTSVNVTQIWLTVNILTTATGATGNKQFLVYGYSSEDGSTYRGDSAQVDNVDGTDKALTALGAPSQLALLGAIPAAQAANIVTLHGVFEVTGPLGGVPRKWGIVLFNDQGTAAGATITATYTEVSYS